MQTLQSFFLKKDKNNNKIKRNIDKNIYLYVCLSDQHGPNEFYTVCLLAKTIITKDNGLF